METEPSHSKYVGKSNSTALGYLPGPSQKKSTRHNPR